MTSSLKGKITERKMKIYKAMAIPTYGMEVNEAWVIEK
jgi:hypothetical protein